jgi:hypothetical protein
MQNSRSQDSRSTTSATVRRSSADCDLQIPRDEQCASLRVEADRVSKAEVGTGDPAVTDDLGHPFPPHDRELDAIERYLGADIDQLLRLCK